MKKIILIAYDLNPKLGSEAGKAHSFLIILSKYFSVKVFVDARHQEDITSYRYRSNIDFDFVSTQSFFSHLLASLGLYNFLYKIFIKRLMPILKDNSKKNSYDLIHFITPSGIHSYSTIYKYIDVPYIIGPLGGGLPTPKKFICLFSFKDVLIDVLRRFFYLSIKHNSNYNGYFICAKRILIGTEYILDLLPAVVKQKTTVIFDTCVDMRDFDSYTIRRPQREFVKIVVVGRLVAIKGVILLLEALSKIRAEKSMDISKLKILILGEGPLRKEIEKLINKNALEEVIKLLGNIKRNEVIEHLFDSDIFCLPTIREHGGGAILEAMAAGLPVITSNYGGPKYSVTDDCGIKIDVNNYEQYINDLSRAIIKLASDRKLRIQMGRKARERVEREFSLDALEKKIVALYKEVINENI